MDAVPRRTGTLLVYAGSIGLATTFLVCVFFNDVMHALRGWACDGHGCTVPAQWAFEQSHDVFVLWFGGLRSVLQIRAGVHMQASGFNRRLPLVAYLVVAALDCTILGVIGELPAWTMVMTMGWPIVVYTITRTDAVRSLVWDPAQIPTARVV